MNLSDKIIKAYLEGKPMPLKGHTKITLTDVNTGKKEVVESDNMVTNAVASILAHNYSGLTDFHKLLPLKDLFGGVLMFQNNITEDADNYNPPSETTNPMIANAGQTAHSTASTTRGNPNGGEKVETETSIKYVWDWATNQGNGSINCVCLCPNSFGDNGLKPFSTSGNLWTPIAVDNSALSGMSNTNFPNSRDDCKRLPISIDSDGQTGKAIYWSGTTFEEITVRKDWFKFGIMRGVNDFQEVSNRSATVRAMTKKQICEDSTYYYCYEITGSTSVKIDKVKKSDFTVTQDDASISGASLYTGSYAFTALDACIPRFGYDGKYLYLPNSSANGFVGINLSNYADVVEVTGPVSLLLSDIKAGAGYTSARPIVVSEGLVYGDTYIINGTAAYQKTAPTQIYSSESTNRPNALDIVRIGTSVYAYPCGKNLYNDRGQGAAHFKVYLSTINNLNSEVTKTSSQNMKCEYTLTEA